MGKFYTAEAGDTGVYIFLCVNRTPQILKARGIKSKSSRHLVFERQRIIDVEKTSGKRDVEHYPKTPQVDKRREARIQTIAKAIKRVTCRDPSGALSKLSLQWCHNRSDLYESLRRLIEGTKYLRQSHRRELRLHLASRG